MTNEKQIIVNQIKQNIANRLGSDACALADEALSSLAYACTFSGIRHFKDYDMGPNEWADLSATITIAELMKVQDSLKRYRPGYNRLFFLLGCFATVYGARYQSTTRRSDHKQRVYTRAQLRDVITSIGSLTDADL